MNKQIEELEAKTLVDGFWNDTKNSGIVLQKLKLLKSKYSKFSKLQTEMDNLEELNDLLILEEDEDLVKELLNNTKKLEKELSKFEIETLLCRKI